ncbi:MAG: orotidine-5'-phosphate decarboxylase [Anaerolineae bacterium]|jgi:uridine monophosphate synthetase|nr:orotidine-5'-phosphate decarboxylase [Anaerolineae bacterium]MDH7474682.1 orotidine-5'-phosphate decarboxylase [Anaerolineae bacterium]
MGFYEKLNATIERNDSLLCVGLDPRPEQIPAGSVLDFNRRIIDATHDLVCAYKPNLAFYEALGPPGLEVLQCTIACVPAGIPVILDAKRGDIGSTAEAYARASFETWGADAVTVNPYMGRDAVEPFAAYTDRGVFLLCHTSNPGAHDLQTLPVRGDPLYLAVARRAMEWNTHGNIGLVMGATFPDALRAVREIAPRMWILLPGIGAQGGDLEAALAAGLDADGHGVIVNVSRGVIFATDPRAAAMAWRERINRARAAAPTSIPGTANLPPFLPRLSLDLFDIGCVRFGDFTLASGRHSPIYLDLRLLASHPRVLSEVARAYAHLLRDIPYQRIAAIPYAALPIGTAVALDLEKPLVYPRKEVKSYGTGRAIEGEFVPGERAVVLDDLITTGGSKIKAITPLEEAGLQVQDIVVLIDREQGGREELAAHGYRLHAAFTLREMLNTLRVAGRITDQQYNTVMEFLASENSDS